jgi:MoaA/NifB/PqqE/SkfB family radical SAM enzyme
VARRLGDSGVPYVAFGGGEPLQVPHVWEVFQALTERGVAIKIETDGQALDEAGADRLRQFHIDNVQVSVDGATPETHALMRPGSASFEQATGALRRLSARDLPGELVFVPSRQNLHEAVDAYELAAELGAREFVTGPMMRLGRAARNWASLAPSPEAWAATAERLRARAARHGPGAPRLAIYPHDIETEIQQRVAQPQAMLLIVPNGRVKLLNALPFAPADLRRHSVAEAWRRYQQAWRSATVADFAARCRQDPGLLRHANETWPVPEVEHG